MEVKYVNNYNLLGELNSVDDLPVIKHNIVFDEEWQIAHAQFDLISSDPLTFQLLVDIPKGRITAELHTYQIDEDYSEHITEFWLTARGYENEQRFGPFKGKGPSYRPEGSNVTFDLEFDAYELVVEHINQMEDADTTNMCFIENIKVRANQKLGDAYLIDGNLWAFSEDEDFYEWTPIPGEWQEKLISVSEIPSIYGEHYHNYMAISVNDNPVLKDKNIEYTTISNSGIYTKEQLKEIPYIIIGTWIPGTFINLYEVPVKYAWKNMGTIEDNIYLPIMPLAPHFLRDVLEYKSIINSEEKLFGDIAYKLTEAKDNRNILKLNESGLSIWESTFGILPNTSTESLSFRRERILNRLLTKPPFTEDFLRKKLDDILGVNNYLLNINANNYEIILETILEDQAWVQELFITINTIKPANMVYINKASTNTNLLMNELVTYEKNTWNYKLGSWKLSTTLPFESKGFGGTIKVATEPSIKLRGIQYAFQGVSDSIYKARINGSVLVDVINKQIIGNQLSVEFTVLETEASDITQIELVDSAGNTISGTESKVYVKVLDEVNIKSVFTMRQGV